MATFLSPAALEAAWAATPGTVYVDVRTVTEFARGRPRGVAVNIPWEFRHPRGDLVIPNTSFLLVAQARFAADTPLVVGCEDDRRAVPAAACLEAAGFLDVSVLRGGHAAWRELRYMSSTDNRPGVSYVSLLVAARRPAGTAPQAAGGWRTLIAHPRGRPRGGG